MKIKLELNDRDYSFLNMFDRLRRLDANVTWDDVVETGLIKMLMDVNEDGKEDNSRSAC